MRWYHLRTTRAAGLSFELLEPDEDVRKGSVRRKEFIRRVDANFDLADGFEVDIRDGSDDAEDFEETNRVARAIGVDPTSISSARRLAVDSRSNSLFSRDHAAFASSLTSASSSGKSFRSSLRPYLLLNASSASRLRFSTFFSSRNFLRTLTECA